jgi:DHA3 family tetracycline resistance protein-like MFS transporter
VRKVGISLASGYDAEVFRRGKLEPVKAYFLVAFGDAFVFTFGENILILFQTNEAGLSAAQLLTLTALYRIVIMVCEVPTGVVADTMGRRTSVCLGFMLLGLGLLISGLQAEFRTLLIGQATLGVGFTFLSGAHQAWIADEVGVEAANPIYVRTAQLAMWLWVAAVPLSVLLSAWQINLPILVSGVALLAIGLVLLQVMPEEGFQRPERAGSVSMRWVFATMRSTYSDGLRAVRGRPLLITILVISAATGIVALGFQRLWLLQFNENIGYPDTFGLSPVGWFGVLRAVSALLSVALLEIVRRRGAEAMSSHAIVVRSLFLINALQLNAVLLLALTSSFELAFLAYCATFALSYAYDPFYIAWINQNVESGVRATVISMNSQAESLGRIAGAPLIGAVAATAGVRAGLTLAGLAMTVPLILFLRAFGQGRSALSEGPAEAGE